MVRESSGRRPEKLELEDPNKRRVIMVLPSTEIDAIKYSSDEKYKRIAHDKEKNAYPWLCLLEDSVELYPESDKPFLNSLKEKRLLQSGNILVQSDSDPSTYFKADKVRDEFVKPKWYQFAIVCHYLGATDWKIRTSRTVGSTSKKNLQLSFSNLVEIFNFGGKSYREEVRQELIDILGEAIGSKPDVKAAEKYISEQGLTEDLDIQAVVRFREAKNEFTKFKYELNFLKEVEDNLELAAGLLIPQSMSSILTKFDSHVKKFEKFRVAVEVNFPTPK